MIRRGSGGGAVLCDPGLLEVDVALPAGHALLDADVTESYRFLGQAWVDALAALGLEGRLVTVAEARALPDDRRAAARVACYAGLSPYEVVDPDGRKLVGLCQRRRRGAALFQCSLACGLEPAASRATCTSTRRSWPRRARSTVRRTRLGRAGAATRRLRSWRAPRAPWRGRGPARRRPRRRPRPRPRRPARRSWRLDVARALREPGAQRHAQVVGLGLRLLAEVGVGVLRLGDLGLVVMPVGRPCPVARRSHS